MKKFFLCGDHNANIGPSNVNRSLIRAADGDMAWQKLDNPLFGRLEKLVKCACYPAVVFSGGATRAAMSVVRMTGKRVIYLKHGDNRFESMFDRGSISPESITLEYDLMKMADVIAAVSEGYAGWVREHYPEFAPKVTFVNNSLSVGSDISPRGKRLSGPYVIAVSGGNRPIKNNLNVCRAVETLRARGMDIEVRVYGSCIPGGEDLGSFPFVRFMGHLDHSPYYTSLLDVDLFVLASRCESFGLVVGDAVSCGCSLLTSVNVGARCLFSSLSPTDTIGDCDDVAEIASRIEWLLENPNSASLRPRLDLEACSPATAYRRLKEIAIGR